MEFVKSLDRFTDPQQQSSILLQNIQYKQRSIAGGEADRRAAVASGIQNSPDT